MKKEKGRRVITATSIYFLLKFGYLGTLNHSKQPCSLFFFFLTILSPIQVIYYGLLKVDT